jgi:hypothetical protein
MFENQQLQGRLQRKTLSLQRINLNHINPYPANVENRVSS